AAAPAAPAATATDTPVADDFFVLPGESLAKYRGGVEPQAEDFYEGSEETDAVAESAVESEPEMVSDLAAESVAELATVIDEVEEVVAAPVRAPAFESAM